MSDTNFAAHVLREAFKRYKDALQFYIRETARAKQGGKLDRQDYAAGVLKESADMVDWLEQEIAELFKEEGHKINVNVRMDAENSST